MNRFPIYIPSKGRARECTTPSLLADAGMSYKIVVEPQDAYGYRDAHGDERVLVMDEDDRGLAYVRNFIKRHSIGADDTRHWQVDDDVTKFMRRLDNRNWKSDPAMMFHDVETYVTRFANIAVAGMILSAYAFSHREPIIVNRQASGCFLVDNLVSNVWYRDGVPEDTDYSLQVLTRGWCTMLFTRMMIETPSPGSNDGGCSEIEYGGDKRLARYKKLQSLWPRAFEIGRTKNRMTIKPSRIWGKFPQRPIPKQ